MPAQILVVDDEPDIRFIIEQRFRKRIKSNDLQFHFALNGVEALNTLQTEPDIHLVLADINMPRMDGLTLLSRLQDFARPIQTVIISAYGDMQNIRSAMNRGAYDFLTKPLDLTDLEITLDKTLVHVAKLKEIKQLREEKQAALQKAYDQERIARQAQDELLSNLKRLDRMKDEFLANTSHELRTPLNGLIGITESLLDGVAGELNPRQKANLNLILIGSKRLANLVNDLLDFSTVQHSGLILDLKSVDARVVVDLVTQVLRPEAAAKLLTLDNQIPADLPALKADPDRIQQILYNLIGNAIKFTLAGTITIAARAVDGQIEMSVTDTGIGILADQLDSIFQAFVQLDGGATRRHGGTGLGLAITKQLVELHGGQIAVTSEPGQGTTVTFSIPQSQQSPETQIESASDTLRPLPDLHVAAPDVAYTTDSEAPAATSEFDILSIDDDPVNTQVVINHLSLQNYTVTHAVNATDALQKMKQRVATGRPFDLLLMDLMMPGMSGFELCQKIREADDLGPVSAHELPILILTARQQVADLRAAFEVGANDFITKPINKHELLTRIKNHLESARAFRHIKTLTRQLQTLLGSTRELIQKRSPARAMQITCDRVVETLFGDEIMPYQFYLPDGDPKKSQKYKCHTISLDENSERQVKIRPVSAQNLPQLSHIKEITLQEGVLWLPIRMRDTVYALIEVHPPIAPELSTDIRDFLNGLLTSTAMALANFKYAEQQRMALVGQMASGIIHDLKTPIATIRCFAELVTEVPDKPDEQKKFMGIIIKEVDRMADMVNGILEYARGTVRVEPAWHDLADYMNDIVLFLRQHLDQKQMKLVYQADFEGKIYVDSERFSRVIFNIVMNAAEAMETHGTCHIRIQQENDWIHFAIKDEGPGIPEEIQETLFDPFVSLGKRNGTGLGLAIVKQIVEEHGGRITFETEPNHGTRFDIRIPLSD